MRIVLFVFLCVLSCGKAHSEEVVLPDDRKILVFDGRISAASVDKFIELASKVQGKKLVVLSSGGGELLAGIKLGYWIRENGVDVAVQKLCMSACANYAFAAGVRKFILPGGVVVWHGNTLEKHFSEIQAKKEEKLSMLRGESPENAAEIEKIVSALDKLRMQQSEELRFYRRIGIDEYLTRAGEDVYPEMEVAWVAPKELMVGYGFSDLVAPEDYGTPEYLKGNQLLSRRKELVFSLNVDRQGKQRAYRLE